MYLVLFASRTTFVFLRFESNLFSLCFSEKKLKRNTFSYLIMNTFSLIKNLKSRVHDYKLFIFLCDFSVLTLVDFFLVS